MPTLTTPPLSSFLRCLSTMWTLAVMTGRAHTTRLLCWQLSLARPLALGTALARAGPVMALVAVAEVGAAATLVVVPTAAVAVAVMMAMVVTGLVATVLAGTGLVVAMAPGLRAVTAG